jgi:hypothetical protein
VIQEPKVKEKHHQEDLEGTKEPWEEFDEEQTLEPEIEEFLSCMSSDPKTDQQLSEDLHGMTREDIQTSANKQENQGNSDYIAVWFQRSIGPQHSFILQHFLAPYQLEQLVPHI